MSTLKTVLFRMYVASFGIFLVGGLFFLFDDLKDGLIWLSGTLIIFGLIGWIFKPFISSKDS